MKRAIGKIEFIICKDVESREDGMELVELANRIHQMLVAMDKLSLTMIDGSKEELEILDVEIEWDEIIENGVSHSWFEIKDGVMQLVRAADIEKKKNS